MKKEKKKNRGFVLAGMTIEAQEARREYQRAYRGKNRDRINRKRRDWNARNRERLREYQKRYWEKAAKVMEG